MPGASSPRTALDGSRGQGPLSRMSPKLWTGSGFSRRAGPVHSPDLPAKLTRSPPQARAARRLASTPSLGETRQGSHPPRRSPSLDPTQGISCQPPHRVPRTQLDPSFTLQNITSKPFRIRHPHENTHVLIYENTERIPWTHTLSAEILATLLLGARLSRQRGLRPGGRGAP